jgi:hypothetical protein
MQPKTENPLTPPLALGGAGLLLISLFLNWFSLEAGAQGQNVSLGFARPDTAVLLLVIVIALAAGIGAGRMRGTLSGQSALLSVAGGVAVLYVVVNLIKKPQLLDLASSAFDEAKKQAGGQLGGADFSVGIEIGVILALLGSLLVLAAGLMEMLGAGGGGGAGRGAGAGVGPGTGGGIGAGGPAGPPAAAAPPAAAQPPAGGGAGGGAPAPADRNPGWQPDPYGQARLRYWDGNAWTEHTG